MKMIYPYIDLGSNDLGFASSAGAFSSLPFYANDHLAP
jgi:hypothetical protein